jgi:hypothetical protein
MTVFNAVVRREAHAAAGRRIKAEPPRQSRGPVAVRRSAPALESASGRGMERGSHRLAEIWSRSIPRGSPRPEGHSESLGFETTIRNAVRRIDIAADPNAGDVAKCAGMLRAAGKWIRTFSADDLSRAFGEAMPPIERGLRLSGLRLVSAIARRPDLDLCALIEALTANPHEPLLVLGLVGLSPAGLGVLERLGAMYPARDGFEVDRLRLELERDLSVGDLDQKIRDGFRERDVRGEDVRAFFGALAEVRESMRIGAVAGDDFQRSNWLHTRAEIERTIRMASVLDLSPEETLIAALGSLASDAFKNASRYELLTHNRVAAEIIAPVLISRHFDPSDSRTARLIEGAMAVAHEHQITPAAFMIGAMKAELGLEHEEAARTLVEKMARPYDAMRSGGEIVFSDVEERALISKGIPGWAVPDVDAPHRRATQAAIAGDIGQYGSDEGVLKIAADLRYPWHPGGAHLGDARLQDAISTCIDRNFALALEGLADPALRRATEAERAAARGRFGPGGPIAAELERRLRAHEDLPSGEPIPYWDVEVPVGAGKQSEEQVRAVEIVRDTFRRVVSDLGRVPLDPFGTYAGTYKDSW